MKKIRQKKASKIDRKIMTRVKSRVIMYKIIENDQKRRIFAISER
jgi:hypothetical protein